MEGAQEGFHQGGSFFSISRTEKFCTLVVHMQTRKMVKLRTKSWIYCQAAAESKKEGKYWVFWLAIEWKEDTASACSVAVCGTNSPDFGPYHIQDHEQTRQYPRLEHLGEKMKATPYNVED